MEAQGLDIRWEADPEAALRIMRKAAAGMLKKKRIVPNSWRMEHLTLETIMDDLEASADEFMVVYLGGEPFAAGILQKGDRTRWAPWPSEKKALYGYYYAGNPDYPYRSKTDAVFPLLKAYGASNGYPVIRIDMRIDETAKQRLYEAQGFRRVGRASEGSEEYFLYEFDPEEAKGDG